MGQLIGVGVLLFVGYQIVRGIVSFVRALRKPPR